MCPKILKIVIAPFDVSKKIGIVIAPFDVSKKIEMHLNFGVCDYFPTFVESSTDLRKVHRIKL